MAADRVPAVYGYSMKALDVDGAWVLTPRIHADGRGSFLEWFRDSEFQQDLGYRMDVAQANCSVSRRGAIRGIHFSDVPPGQAKYVTAMRENDVILAIGPAVTVLLTFFRLGRYPFRVQYRLADG